MAAGTKATELRQLGDEELVNKLREAKDNFSQQLELPLYTPSRSASN
jgi:ribosomal protein L29